MKKFLKQEPEVTTTPPGHKLTVIPRFCKGCEICISFCPKGVLALDAKTLKVTVLNPEKCTGCRLCELYCPDFAIFVETAKRAGKGVQGARSSGGQGAETPEPRNPGTPGPGR